MAKNFTISVVRPGAKTDSFRQETNNNCSEKWRDKVYEIISPEISDVDVPQAMKILVYCTSVAI